MRFSVYTAASQRIARPELHRSRQADQVGEAGRTTNGAWTVLDQHYGFLCTTFSASYSGGPTGSTPPAIAPPAIPSNAPSTAASSFWVFSGIAIARAPTTAPTAKPHSARFFRMPAYRTR